jgi:predicted dehydrogenase
MAASIDECKRMIAAAEKAGKLLMVNQAQRLVPAHLKAREVMASGILGRIFHVTAVFGHSGPDNWHPPAKWFFDKKQARFGAMADLGVHKADLVRYLTGLEVAEVGAFMAQLHKHGDVEDNFVACLHFESGAVGTLASSWTIYGHDANFVHIHCEKGTLKVGTYRDRPVVAGLTDPACEITFDPPPSPNDYPGTWQMDASGHFLRACMGVEEPFCTGEEGMRSLAILTAAEKAAQTGQMQKVQV